MLIRGMADIRVRTRLTYESDSDLWLTQYTTATGAGTHPEVLEEFGSHAWRPEIKCMDVKYSMRVIRLMRPVSNRLKREPRIIAEPTEVQERTNN